MRMKSALLTISFLACLTTTTSAGILSITPTRLTVSQDSEVVAFNLRNDGDENAVVEIRVFEWTDVNNPKALQPTKDLLIVPPVVEIPASQTQVLRVAPRLSGELDSERMYRLLIQEVSSGLTVENGVGFAVEMSLPVFMVPEGAAADPFWTLRWKDVATPQLALVNQGEAHLRMRSFGLYDDPEGEPILEISDATYVLAGEEKAWPLNAELIQRKGPLTVKAETTAGLTESTVVVPGG